MLTDFGLDDHYVAVMKSYFLSQFQDIRFIDISHMVLAQKISSAAYLLLASWNYLPPECTIKIFTESGDLIKTIEHAPLSKSGLFNWNMLTDNQQAI